MVNACINTTALTHNNHNIQNFLEDKLTSSLIGSDIFLFENIKNPLE